MATGHSVGCESTKHSRASFAMQVIARNGGKNLTFEEAKLLAETISELSQLTEDK